MVGKGGTVLGIQTWSAGAAQLRCYRCPQPCGTSPSLLVFRPTKCQAPVKINMPGRLWAMKTQSWFGSHLPPFKNSSVSH